MKYYPTYSEIEDRARKIALEIVRTHGDVVNLYGVPRGGIPVAYLINRFLPNSIISQTDHAEYRPLPDRPLVVVDDIIDSGKTQQHYNEHPFYALFSKLTEPDLGWVVFPWEGDAAGSIEDNITRILQFIGEDPTREGLLETPKRVVKSWGELFSGYGKDVKSCFKIFDVKHDELVLMQGIELYSSCEHHMLPFVGRAHIAYIADGRVIGASKLARILEIFARRLQVQERLGAQVVDALMEHLRPKGAACIIEARHFCMCSRGVGKQHSIMKTSAMRGIFLEDSDRGRAARAELMSLLK